MKLINRGNQQSPLARQACDIALAAHQERRLRAQQDAGDVHGAGGRREGLGGGGEPQGELRGHGDDRHATTAIFTRAVRLILKYHKHFSGNFIMSCRKQEDVWPSF